MSKKNHWRKHKTRRFRKVQPSPLFLEKEDAKTQDLESRRASNSEIEKARAYPEIAVGQDFKKALTIFSALVILIIGLLIIQNKTSTFDYFIDYFYQVLRLAP